MLWKNKPWKNICSSNWKNSPQVLGENNPNLGSFATDLDYEPTNPTKTPRGPRWVVATLPPLELHVRGPAGHGTRHSPREVLQGTTVERCVLERMRCGNKFGKKKRKDETLYIETMYINEIKDESVAETRNAGDNLHQHSNRNTSGSNNWVALKVEITCYLWNQSS